MKASEAKKLIGKSIRYRRVSRDYVYPFSEATILEVLGKNVLIDHGGMTDWLWLPDVQIKPVERVVEEGKDDER